MKSLDFGRYALCSCVAAAMLAGCGGPQPPIGTLGAMPQSSAVGTHADPGTSRMLPETGSGDLIYATGGCGGVCVLSYPNGALLDSISLSGGVGGDCSNAMGDVFVTNNNQILKYAHGGTTPIATLTLPGDDATGCSVDSATHNLAVVFGGSGVNIAIFANAEGTPTVYSAHTGALYCGYDDASNLFVSGSSGSTPQLSELANGAGDFSILSVIGNLGNPGQVQWDGAYLTYEGLSRGSIKISRLTISGSKARVVSKTQFESGIRNAIQSWIYDGAVVIPYSTRGQAIDKVGLWAYPKRRESR